MGFTAEYADTEPMRAEIDEIAGPLLVEFGAPWCPHCHAVQPVLEDLLSQHPEVKHVKIYDGPGQPLGRSFKVKLWPNLVFMRDDKVMMQLARPKKDEIVQGLRAVVANSEM